MPYDTLKHNPAMYNLTRDGEFTSISEPEYLLILNYLLITQIPLIRQLRLNIHFQEVLMQQ